MANKKITVGNYEYNVELNDDGTYGAVELISNPFDIMVEANSKPEVFSEKKSYSNQDPVSGLQDIAEDVQGVFGKKIFYERFPKYGSFTEDGDINLNSYSYINKDGNEIIYSIGETELDALTHFYGQMLGKQEFGGFYAQAAGLYNEVVGTLWKGNTWEGTKIDFINNASGRFNIDERHLETLTNLTNNLPVSPDAFNDLLIYGLENTVTPPETEQYDVTPQKLYRKIK